MVSLATNMEIKNAKPKSNDEFDNYLKRQCLKTTFNGLEIETFSWYKKVLGLLQLQKRIKNLNIKKRDQLLLVGLSF